MTFFFGINSIPVAYRVGTLPTLYGPFPPLYPTVTIYAKIQFVTKSRSLDGNTPPYSEVLRLKIWPALWKKKLFSPVPANKSSG